MLHQIDDEISAALLDLALFLNGSAMFVSPPMPPKSTRQRRGSSVGLAALAALGLSGEGLAFGSSDSCGLRGVFKNCQDQSKANAKDGRRFADFQTSLTNCVAEFMADLDEKFFLVENELGALNAIQSEMSSTPDNWSSFYFQ